jgi:HPt (histidine-containing phosphotransfer) domain-containing protein
VIELHEEVGAEALADVLDLFTSEIEEGLARLERATTAQTIAAEFHFLKGAALNLGLDGVASICAAGEQRAAHGAVTAQERAEVARLFPELCRTLGREWRARVDAERALR